MNELEKTVFEFEPKIPACFGSVFLFGSIMWATSPEDIDLLLIYGDDFEEITISESRRKVLDLLGAAFDGIIVDLTLLSQPEFEVTEFLDQVPHKSVRIGSDNMA